NRPG
ncbi:bet protein, partial [Escherichia coli EC1868]